MEEKIKNYNGINISDQDNKNNVKKNIIVPKPPVSKRRLKIKAN